MTFFSTDDPDMANEDPTPEQEPSTSTTNDGNKAFEEDLKDEGSQSDSANDDVPKASLSRASSSGGDDSVSSDATSDSEDPLEAARLARERLLARTMNKGGGGGLQDQPNKSMAAARDSSPKRGRNIDLLSMTKRNSKSDLFDEENEEDGGGESKSEGGNQDADETNTETGTKAAEDLEASNAKAANGNADAEASEVVDTAPKRGRNIDMLSMTKRNSKSDLFAEEDEEDGGGESKSEGGNQDADATNIETGTKAAEDLEASGSKETAAEAVTEGADLQASEVVDTAEDNVTGASDQDDASKHENAQESSAEEPMKDNVNGAETDDAAGESKSHDEKEESASAKETNKKSKPKKPKDSKDSKDSTKKPKDKKKEEKKRGKEKDTSKGKDNLKKPKKEKKSKKHKKDRNSHGPLGRPLSTKRLGTPLETLDEGSVQEDTNEDPKQAETSLSALLTSIEKAHLNVPSKSNQTVGEYSVGSFISDTGWSDGTSSSYDSDEDDASSSGSFHVDPDPVPIEEHHEENNLLEQISDAPTTAEDVPFAPEDKEPNPSPKLAKTQIVKRLFAKKKYDSLDEDTPAATSERPKSPSKDISNNNNTNQRKSFMASLFRPIRKNPKHDAPKTPEGSGELEGSSNRDENTKKKGNSSEIKKEAENNHAIGQQDTSNVGGATSYAALIDGILGEASVPKEETMGKQGQGETTVGTEHSEAPPAPKEEDAKADQRVEGTSSAKSSPVTSSHQRKSFNIVASLFRPRKPKHDSPKAQEASSTELEEPIKSEEKEKDGPSGTAEGDKAMDAPEAGDVEGATSADVAEKGTNEIQETDKIPQNDEPVMEAAEPITDSKEVASEEKPEGIAPAPEGNKSSEDGESPSTREKHKSHSKKKDGQSKKKKDHHAPDDASSSRVSRRKEKDHGGTKKRSKSATSSKKTKKKETVEDAKSVVSKKKSKHKSKSRGSTSESSTPAAAPPDVEKQDE